MSRIGKKPIPFPKGVKYTVEGNTVLVEGPKGKVTNHAPDGVTLDTRRRRICSSSARTIRRRRFTDWPARWSTTPSKA